MLHHVAARCVRRPAPLGSRAGSVLLFMLLVSQPVLAASPDSSPPSVSPTDTSVTGVVRSATDGRPMAEIPLTLGDRTAVSDAQGRFNQCERYGRGEHHLGV